MITKKRSFKQVKILYFWLQKSGNGFFGKNRLLIMFVFSFQGVSYFLDGARQIRSYLSEGIQQFGSYLPEPLQEVGSYLPKGLWLITTSIIENKMILCMITPDYRQGKSPSYSQSTTENDPLNV